MTYFPAPTGIPIEKRGRKNKMADYRKAGEKNLFGGDGVPLISALAPGPPPGGGLPSNRYLAPKQMFVCSSLGVCLLIAIQLFDWSVDLIAGQQAKPPTSNGLMTS